MVCPMKYMVCRVKYAQLACIQVQYQPNIHSSLALFHSVFLLFSLTLISLIQTVDFSCLRRTHSRYIITTEFSFLHF